MSIVNPHKKFREEPTSFIVNGRGEFPLDMLRHDCCYPIGKGMHGISQYNNVAIDIELRTVRGQSICPGRWRSFGWTVVSVEKAPHYNPHDAEQSAANQVY